MRTKEYLLATLKETPSDAETVSHRLMLRAGMIRPLTTGIYTWLPTGLRVLRKVENIVRSEMDAINAQEILMPMVLPAPLWQETKRWQIYGAELLRLTDRNDREYCLGPTHEEVITDLFRREIQGYRQLPAHFYQIQTKFRDEIRPRFGALRAREFVMKDSYSFHLDEQSLKDSYWLMHATYSKIFQRMGLTFKVVEADSGAIGGNVSHEFHVLADSGEDAVVFSDSSDYAANIETASSLTSFQVKTIDNNATPLEKVATPNVSSVPEVASFFATDASQVLKTLVVKSTPKAPGDSGLVALLLCGDDELNNIKAEKLPEVQAPLCFADETDLLKHCDCPAGSLGPLELNIPIIGDHRIASLSNFICGANKDGYHLRHVHWQRDLQLPSLQDIRKVKQGDPSPDGKGALHIKRGIEVGHIFQLGTRYSEAMNAVVQDKELQQRTVIMGTYGLGISRVVAAAIEQHHDDRGIIWPAALAPFDVALIPLNSDSNSYVHSTTMMLYQQLQEKGIEVLLDDRAERPGVRFADMDLLGIPHRIVVSPRGEKQRSVEYKLRTADKPKDMGVDEVIAFLCAN